MRSVHPRNSDGRGMESTITGPARQGHLSDAQLIALLDGEDGWEAERMRAHTEACARCREALAGLGAKVSVVEAWFGGVEPTAEPVPAATAPRWHFGFLQAAAVLALVAVPALAYPGIRAWLGDGEAASPSEEVTNAGARGVPAEGGVTVLRFSPAGSALVVRVSGSLAESLDLEVVRGSGAEAVLRASDPAGEATISELGLEVRPSRAGAQYRLEVPGSVNTVTVVTPSGHRVLGAPDLEGDGATP